MTKAQKKRARAAAKTRQMFAAANISKASPSLILSGYEAANDSPMRGYVYFPGKGDTRRELDSLSDREIRRRIHWLWANCGIIRRIILGQARLLGFLTPQPLVGNEWDRLAFDAFQNRAGSPGVFDPRGRLDFYTSQIRTNIERRKDGRCLGVLTENESGSAAMMLYEASQIESGGAFSGYEEGVLTNRNDRHLAYSLRDGRDPSKYVSVGARNAIYFPNWDNIGRIHGVPLLAHAVPNMLDVVELRGMRKHGAKLHSMVGVVVEQGQGPMIQLPTGEVLGMPAVREVQVDEEVEVEVDDGAGGTRIERQVQTVTKLARYEQMMGDGGIPSLQPGQTLRVVADDRPTPNNLEFERILIADIADGADGPPAAVIYHLADLKGPGVRYSMEEVRRWIRLEHRRQAQECQRFYAYCIAKEIKAGRLPLPMANGKEVDYWRKVAWIGQPSMTIDAGRDGALTITRLESGLSTWADEWGERGEFGREKIRQRVREFAEAKRDVIEASKEFKVDLNLGEVFPRFAGAPQSANQEAA
jgi:hypothetical protein